MGRASRDTIRVLHVDDEPGFADLTATYLEREDERFVVDTATNADDGLDRLAETTVDCIVSDYNMPGRNGLDFLEIVRETRPDLPFILFTGKGSEEVASEAISTGVSDYLQKGTGTERYELLANRVLTHVERTRTQRELEERKAHLSQAQTVADLGSWQFDLTTDRLVWSDEVYRIFGVPDDETMSFERFLEQVHPEDRERVEETWTAALDGAEYDIEHRIATGDGETRWVRERADIEFDEDGNPTDAFGVVQDVTDRKQREQELQLFRKAVEAAGHSIYWTDASGEIQYVNPAFEDTTGYTADEAVGRNPRFLRSGEHEADFYEELWDTILSGETWRNEVTNTRKDGDVYVVDQTIAPVEDEAGEMEYFVAVNADITPIRERERRLKEERDRREALFRNPSDPILEIEFDGESPVIAASNEAFADVFGFESDEVVGRPVSDVIVPGDDDVQDRHDEIKRRVLQGEPVDTTVRRRTRWGSREFLLRVFPIEVADGHRGSYAIYTDVSGRVDREENR